MAYFLPAAFSAVVLEERKQTYILAHRTAPHLLQGLTVSFSSEECSSGLISTLNLCILGTTSLSSYFAE